MCLCFVPTFGTYAADSTESSSNDDDQDWYDAAPELDDKGRRIKGTFDCLHEQKNDKVDKQWAWKGFFATSDGCAYWLKHGVQSSGNLSWTPYEFVCTSKILNNQSYRLFYVYNDNKNPDLSNSRISSGFEKYYYDYYGEEDTGHFSSTLPIFKAGDTDAINAYLENGDLSGAENENDISQPEQDDSVELPKNLRSYGKIGYIDFNTDSTVFGLANGTITYLWDLPSDFNDYTYDVRVKVDYSIKDNSTKSTDWYNAVTDYPYERNSQYDLNTGEPVKRDPSIAEDYRLNRDIMTKFDWQGTDMKKILSFHVEIRNRRGNKCSNWVSIESQMDGSNTTNVKDDDGNIIEDDNYHATNTDNSDDSKYYDSDPKNNSSYIGNNSSVSVTSFIQYIKDGFGLLGSGGLIALMAGLFSYIPASIWTLIKAGIAMAILIMLMSVTINMLSSVFSGIGGGLKK